MKHQAFLGGQTYNAPQDILLGGPVTVDPILLGMCFMRWPAANTNPAGVIPWGMCRMSQMHETRWAVIETSTGAYSASALATLDSIITFQRQNNSKVFFGLYATPTFYASSTPAPTFGDNQTRGPWNLIGECANPTSLAAAANFAAMIITRYNHPSGAWYAANGATLGKGIYAWEPWNEPEPRATPANGNTTAVNGPGVGFWWGSTQQLVDLCVTQYDAIKAVDPAVIVTTPGFTSQSPLYLSQYLSTTGPVTLKTGLQATNAIAFHPYNRNHDGWGSWPDIVQDLRDGITAVKTTAQSAGIGGVPIWLSEWGFDASGVSAQGMDWYSRSSDFRRKWIERLYLTCACAGVSSICPWQWSIITTNTGVSGAWAVDTDGVQQAYRNLQANVVGKTITSATKIPYGAVTVGFSDGGSYSV